MEEKMRKNTLLIIASLLIADVILIVWILAHNFSFPLLDPAGLVASREKRLFVTVLCLGLAIIGSVIATTFFIAWRYREDSTSSTYTPEATGSKSILLFWWILPTIIIIFLSFITWKSTHELDPYKPLQVSDKPMRIQVVALQWKWLFIYPEENIATVNYIVFPEKTPISFELTADAPMNSFWIPRLGGQMYAMTGMVTRTHLIADNVGEYNGSTAEISGVGFAGMKFIAKATTSEVFTNWVKKVKQSSPNLTRHTYELLAKPSEDMKPTYYAAVEKNLYNEIIMKYMAPSIHSATSRNMTSMPGM
jgi:cytochrome o ubiquinol oxidase subunit 2